VWVGGGQWSVKQCLLFIVTPYQKLNLLSFVYWMQGVIGLHCTYRGGRQVVIVLRRRGGRMSYGKGRVSFL